MDPMGPLHCAHGRHCPPSPVPMDPMGPLPL